MFPVYDVSASVPDRPEALGTKEKLWLTPHPDCGLPTKLHLFKIGRAGTGENWAEKATAEIGKAIGLPCAEYHLAICKGIQGVLSPRFMRRGAPLVLGNTLFSTIDKQYDGTLRFKQVRYGVLTAFAILKNLALEQVELTDGTSLEAREAFVGYLLFDALIGNTDRHHENWGIVVMLETGQAPRLHLAHATA